MQKILSRFSFTQKDENRKPISRENWVSLEIDGRIIHQMESFEQLGDAKLFIETPEENEEPRLNFNLPESTMDKGEFRSKIRYEVVHQGLENNRGGVDLDKLEEAIRKTNRHNRRTHGGLVYNLETVNLALEFYKKL